MIEFKPTKRQRRRVELMVGEVSEATIAALIGISVPTLRKHFTVELELGRGRILQDQLERLDKASAGGNVSAAKELARRKDLVPASRSPEAESEPAKLGKKEQANLDAQSAEIGTGWGNLIH